MHHSCGYGASFRREISGSSQIKASEILVDILQGRNDY